MRTVLVTLIGPERTTDLVVDADATVGELMPSLLAAGGVAESHDPESWKIALTGKQPIERQGTLEEAGVLDGAVLVLRREAEGRREVAVAPPPPSGPAGSPLERTRSLLAGGPVQDARRPRRLRQLPDPAGLMDGRDRGLERTIAGTSLTRCATIAVLSPKGGVGKSTLSILLGELFCSLRSDEVLALDADGDYGSLGRVAPARARGQKRNRQQSRIQLGRRPVGNTSRGRRQLAGDAFEPDRQRHYIAMIVVMPRGETMYPLRWCWINRPPVCPVELLVV